MPATHLWKKVGMERTELSGCMHGRVGDELLLFLVYAFWTFEGQRVLREGCERARRAQSEEGAFCMYYLPCVF